MEFGGYGYQNSQYVSRDEMQRELQRWRPIGDEVDISVEDTPGGQVIKFSGVTGGGGEESPEVPASTAYDGQFKVIPLSTTAVHVDWGAPVPGTDAGYLVAGTSSTALSKSGTIELSTLDAWQWVYVIIYYTSSWQVVYDSSTTYPDQSSYSGNPAETFVLATVHMDTGPGEILDIHQEHFGALHLTRIAF